MRDREVAVLVPVLNRPRNVRPLLHSLRETAPRMQVVFVVSPHDRAETLACEAAAESDPAVRVLVAGWRPGRGDYARKINLAVSETSAPWLFQAGDDLRFHMGWWQAALRAAETHGKRVVGTNDLTNPRVIAGGHATHSLVARTYVEDLGTWDAPGKMLCEQYRHNFVDDELVLAAKQRHEWVFAKDAIVEHLHPIGGKADQDDTYRRGQQGFAQDRMLFRARARHAELRRRRARGR